MTPAFDPRPRMTDPQVIYQDWLDVTSAALLAGEIDAFARHVSLPFVMRTITGAIVLETPEDLAQDASHVVEALRAQQVTHYVRLVKRARYLQEDVIEGWHTTHVLRNAVNVVAPYGNRMVMRRSGDLWKVTEADHELGGDRLPLMLLRPQPGAFTERWRAAQSDLAARYARAEPIYQIFLDSLTQCTLDDDFEAWCAHFTWPHLMHYEATDQIAHAPHVIRPKFDLHRDLIRTLDADAFERVTGHAEFLSDDRIVGYHQAIMRRGPEIVFGPVRSRMILSQIDDRWVCCNVANSLAGCHVPPAGLTVTEFLPSLRQIEERMKK